MEGKHYKGGRNIEMLVPRFEDGSPEWPYRGEDCNLELKRWRRQGCNSQKADQRAEV